MTRDRRRRIQAARVELIRMTERVVQFGRDPDAERPGTQAHWTYNMGLLQLEAMRIDLGGKP